ncbi:MAG TPA: phosphatase PAP2 family protein [Candidatus Bathyarchaeia archaeon]|nr:phosphatase PAP2 family protein [Candidatus Bathyarchaeia archaeon]
MNKYFTASVVILGLFVVIAALVSPRLNINSNSAMIRSDSTVFLDINNSHYPALNKLMIWLTEFGREIFWPLAILLLFFFGGWTGKKTAVVIAISMLVLIPLGELAKDIVARPRPVIPKSDFLIAADKEYSFPSGHAVIVSAGAAGALFLFRKTSKQYVVSIILAIEASLVCISRVYVGGHYPLDVVGGILLGVGVSLIFVGIEKRIESVLISIKNLVK